MTVMQDALARTAEPAQTRPRAADSDRARQHRDEAIRLAVRGQFADSEAHSREALRLGPDDVDVLNVLGLALWRQGRPAEAEAIYRRACQITPDDFRVWTNLGLALSNLDRKDEAAQCYRTAVRIQPDCFDARLNLGIVLSEQGKYDEARDGFEAALQLQPDAADAWHQLGINCARMGRRDEAIDAYRRASRIQPDDFLIRTNLGLCLSDHGRKAEAIECLRAALEIRADCFEAQMSLGLALSEQGQFAEAMDGLLAAVRLRPDSAEALQNVGMNLGRLGRWDEAIPYYEQALGLQPETPVVHRNLAYALLCRGDYPRGWPEHEWRLKCEPNLGCRVNRTFWNGDDFRGRTIMLHAEQGYGDTLQFLRYAPLVKRRGGQVAVLSPARLLRLVARCPGVDLAFDGSSYLPPCDIHSPLMSLPSIFGTTLETIPARVPYLATDPVLVDHWRSVLARALGSQGEGVSEDPEGSGLSRPERPFRIGIAWQGNPENYADPWRSFPLESLAPLAELPGVRLINLQTEHGLDQVRALDGRFPVIELPGRRGRDFTETAAIMAQLDLVICPCTAVAHLAGGLGVRTWVALATVADWRWLTDREDSPWYPTIRLFRQKTLGDWADVFRRMTEVLKQELAGERRRCSERISSS